MIGDLWNNNKRRDVCTREGQRFYRGKKYAVEKETGYLVCTTGNRKRLHVAMYEQEILKGEAIPPGYVIHHIDCNKNNNTINNLCCISIEEHEWIHNRKDKGDLSRTIVDKYTGRVIEYK